MKRELGDHIEDMIEAMTYAMEFTENMSHEEFTGDIKTV